MGDGGGRKCQRGYQGLWQSSICPGQSSGEGRFLPGVRIDCYASTIPIDFLKILESLRYAVSSKQMARPDGANLGERYYPAFDGIRAVAACMVFIDHYGGLPYFGHGVSIFFVLSGFLITGVLYDARNTLGRFRTFYIRRSLRIFPLYYAFWIVMLLLTPVWHTQWNRGNLLYLVYAGNHIWGMFRDPVENHMALVHLYIRPYSFFGGVHDVYPLYVGHFWTLSVEEQFYLAWPLVVFHVRSRIHLIRICVATMVVVFAARIIAVMWMPEHMNLLGHLTILRCDEFLLGGFAALVLRGKHASQLLRRGWLLLCTGAAGIAASLCVCLYIRTEINTARWTFTVQTAMFDVLALGCILLAMQERTWLARMLSWRPLRALGRISYGFYVFHDIPHMFYARAVDLFTDHFSYDFSDPQVMGMVAVLAFTCTLVLAGLSYRLIERPFLKLKNKWAPTTAA